MHTLGVRQSFPSHLPSTSSYAFLDTCVHPEFLTVIATVVESLLRLRYTEWQWGGEVVAELHEPLRLQAAYESTVTWGMASELIDPAPRRRRRRRRWGSQFLLSAESHGQASGSRRDKPGWASVSFPQTPGRCGSQNARAGAALHWIQ